MAVTRWNDNLDALRALLAERHPGQPGLPPFAYVKTERAYIGGQRGWLVSRAGSRERLMFVPDAEREQSLREIVEGMLDFYYCSSCGNPLLPGEEVECGLCEARRVMSIMRLREELA